MGQIVSDTQQATSDKFNKIQSFLPWVAFIVIPLIANGIVWKAFVVPQKTKVDALHQARVLAELKPQLQLLLFESHQIRVDAAKNRSGRMDTPTLLQTLQRSAARHSVQIIETKMQGEKSGGNIPLELDVTGGFNKLARWMSDIESEGTFGIESWSLTKTADLLKLNVKMTASGGGA